VPAESIHSEVSSPTINSSVRGSDLVHTFLVDVAVFEIGLDEKLRSWNPGVERLTGYSADEFVGQHTSLIFIPEDRAIDAPLRELQIAVREGVAPDERWHLRKDGSRFWGIGTVRPIFDDRGEHVGYIKSFQDLTHRHQQALALAEAKVLAEASATKRSETMTVLSHELRGPLTAILGALGLLEEFVGKEGKPYIDIIKRATNTQIRLINDMLDIARLEHSKLHIAFATLDAHQAIEESAAMSWPEMHRKKVRLKLDLCAEEHHISADRVRFEQIMTNLLRNATKFTPGGGLIEVITERRDGKLEIVVQDNGIGMTQEAIERIFKPFEQASEEHAAISGGLGLGLAITQQLVEAHGGRITAYSEGEHKGARFTILLPIVDPLP
jgi:PAS domain S-box-containing protein